MDGLFEQMANISKAGAYDIVNEHRGELIEQTKVFRAALNSILDEIVTLNPEEIVNTPALFIKRIGNICNETLSKNRPL